MLLKLVKVVSFIYYYNFVIVIKLIFLGVFENYVCLMIVLLILLGVIDRNVNFVVKLVIGFDKEIGFGESDFFYVIFDG